MIPRPRSRRALDSDVLQIPKSMGAGLEVVWGADEHEIASLIAKLLALLKESDET